MLKITHTPRGCKALVRDSWRLALSSNELGGAAEPQLEVVRLKADRSPWRFLNFLFTAPDLTHSFLLLKSTTLLTTSFARASTDPTRRDAGASTIDPSSEVCCCADSRVYIADIDS
jgi:hypothetical protein